MELKIKPDTGYGTLVAEYYTNHGSFHSGDAGVDLFCLQPQTIPARAYGVKVPLGVCMAAAMGGKKTAFYMYPRSSTGLRTPIRLANSVGIIDAEYRGPLAAIVDNVSDVDFTMQKGERYFQVCAPNLAPINIEMVSELDRTVRGVGGFGSTGK